MFHCKFNLILSVVSVLALPALPTAAARGADNLVADGSFEDVMPADQFGHVFKQWGGWKYEGECEFRVGQVAHTGQTSCLLFGTREPKIRISRTLKNLPAGRYQVSAWLRGLDLGEGVWHMTTEFAFDDKYIHLKKNGTFGWTPLTYVVDVAEAKDVNGPAFGLWAPGYLWIDDVRVERVGRDVSLTPEPVLGEEEKPLAPPSALTAAAVRCPVCGYQNQPEWGACYACGAKLAAAAQANQGPAVKLLTSFDDRNPFEGGTLVPSETDDGKALRLEKDYAVWVGPQDWSGYDYLQADLSATGTRPLQLAVEIHDRQTDGYWTRVNYETIVPPGKSTLIIPLAQLYVGEKGRPGRKLQLGAITRLVFGIGPQPAGALTLDNVRRGARHGRAAEG